LNFDVDKFGQTGGVFAHLANRPWAKIASQDNWHVFVRRLSDIGAWWCGLLREHETMNTYRAFTFPKEEHRAASEAYDLAANKFRLTQQIMDRYGDSVRALAEAEVGHNRDRGGDNRRRAHGASASLRFRATG